MTQRGRGNSLPRFAVKWGFISVDGSMLYRKVGNGCVFGAEKTAQSGGIIDNSVLLWYNHT